MRKPRGAKAGGAWDSLKEGQPSEVYATYYWNERGDKVTDNLRGDDSRIIMDRAIPFIRNATENDRPFFAIIWFHTPHLPVVAGPRHASPYQQYDIRARNYYGCITAMDEQVGRLRKELDDLGIADNTMHWFCSDNGPEGNESAPGSAGPFRGRKRSLYEGGVRVPGILVWPGCTKPRTVSEFPAVTSDYLPTIVDTLGIEMPDSRPLDGISLLPMLQGRMTSRPNPIGFQSRRQVTLNDNRYKLVTDDRYSKFELYDLTEDPGEKNDIALGEPDIVSRMTATVKTWRESCETSDQGKDY